MAQVSVNDPTLSTLPNVIHLCTFFEEVTCDLIGLGVFMNTPSFFEYLLVSEYHPFANPSI